MALWSGDAITRLNEIEEILGSKTADEAQVRASEELEQICRAYGITLNGQGFGALAQEILNQAERDR